MFGLLKMNPFILYYKHDSLCPIDIVYCATIWAIGITSLCWYIYKSSGFSLHMVFLLSDYCKYEFYVRTDWDSTTNQ